MTRNRLVLAAVAAFAVAFLSSALASHGLWVTSDFDPFVTDQDSGYVDLVVHDGKLAFTLDEEQGSLPAEVTGDHLPLDEDVFTDDSGLLEAAHPVALYGGLAVDTGFDWVMVDLEGDGQEIHDAILDRVADLGFEAVEDGMLGGPIRSYVLSDGQSTWRISIRPNRDGATTHLQMVY